MPSVFHLTFALCAFLGLQVVGALPRDTSDTLSLDAADKNTTLAKRVGLNTGDTPTDAKDVTIDCSGFELNCEANCWSILCDGKPRVLQRNNGRRSANNRNCGAASQPFVGSAAQLAARGVARPPGHDDYESAEEYPWASTTQGGWAANISPVHVYWQNVQGGKINDLYASNGIVDQTWFNLNFENFGTSGRPYCTALMQTLPDLSVCNSQANEAEGFDYKSYTYERMLQNLNGPNPNRFQLSNPLNIIGS